MLREVSEGRIKVGHCRTLFGAASKIARAKLVVAGISRFAQAFNHCPTRRG
jgi:hypothetical protein